MNLVIQRKRRSMPNGRSGGFRFSVAQCRKLLESLSDENQIGHVTGIFGPKRVTITKLAQQLDGHREEDLSVEEQESRPMSGPSGPLRKPLLERILALSRRPAGEQVLDADVFIKVWPVNSSPLTD